MIKKAVCILLICLLNLSLSGCWSYRGLNELTIVAGIGIDKDKATGLYHLTVEAVDLTTVKTSGIKYKMIESEGVTIFDAVRNAKKRLINKLYFGNAQVIVISNQIVSEDGIESVIDWFLRDLETRETLSVIISQEVSAKEIIIQDGIDSPIVSYQIKKIIDEDNRVTGATRSVELYKIYDNLKQPGISLVLPAFHNVMNNEKISPEVNGIAVFKQDKLLGYLDANETRHYLFAINQAHGGVLVFDNPGKGDGKITLEIAHNKTKISHSYDGGKVKIKIKVNTETFLDESTGHMDISDEQSIEQIKLAAEKLVAQNVSDIIKKVQAEFNSDIFGFGNRIYKTDLALWNQIGKDWDSLFQTMEVEVTSDVEILNTVYMKKN
ncbi:Ger(x)C family spore germination protein [Oscillospiraceae bacterium PP1C4]